MTNQSAFFSALQVFVADLSSIFTQTTVAFQPEDQLKRAVETLVKSAGSALNMAAINVVTEVQVNDLGGRPDMGVTRQGALTGYIELKAPGKGARPQTFKGENKKQWDKFKNLPNLISTDGNEWTLFRTGAEIGERVQLAGNITTQGSKAANQTDATNLLKLFQAFFTWQPITPSTPKGLAAKCHCSRRPGSRSRGKHSMTNSCPAY